MKGVLTGSGKYQQQKDHRQLLPVIPSQVLRLKSAYQSEPLVVVDCKLSSTSSSNRKRKLRWIAKRRRQ